MIILNKNEIIDKIIEETFKVGLNIVHKINNIIVYIPACKDLDISVEGNSDFEELVLFHDKYKINMVITTKKLDDAYNYATLNFYKSYCVDDLLAYDFSLKIYYKIELEG